MSFKYDEDHPHCRECLCSVCDYFYRNNGYCEEACEECDGKTHIGDCYSFENKDLQMFGEVSHDTP